MSASSSLEFLSPWEARFETFLRNQPVDADAAHDRAHVDRVVASARRLGRKEEATLEVVIPAAWLHDCVITPKDSTRRSEASQLAAEAASTFLIEADYPERWIEPIEHAIAAHSYSANIPPETIEAEIVQDADRLDAIGAVGLARCFMVAGALDHPLYDPDDPFCENRLPDDDKYAIDHFYTKLLDLPETMNTNAARQMAKRRAEFLRTYLDELAAEIGSS